MNFLVGSNNLFFSDAVDDRIGPVLKKPKIANVCYWIKKDK